ncbi:MAG: chromosome segregation protein SMC [Mariprofundaceae bacterium]
MRLKRVELAGFKSFVDPTKIEFGDGITAIVGPNGCGKSNIVDAIRWVLGEHSARHLRGAVMDDLIFQGSESRPPVALCDVELTFTVEKGQLPSPYHESEEIRIRRRLMRDGGSDGFINGKMVRIKDIVDLFLDTGISTRAYAIIEQGAIARMITAKAEERRQLLEEAAGVMKYRSRRREAERKMNSTRQNLERVTDLLEEVRSQCRSLRQQSSRAERFKAMQQECEMVQKFSFAIRYQSQLSIVEKIVDELSSLSSKEREIMALHAEHERNMIEARSVLVEHEQHAQKQQDHLRNAEQERGSLQQKSERLAGERRLLAERQASVKHVLEEVEKRIEQNDQETQTLAQQLEQSSDVSLQQEKEKSKEQLSIAHAALTEQRHCRDQLLANYERLRSESEHAEKRFEQAAQALERLEKRQHVVDQQHQQAVERVEQLVLESQHVDKSRQSSGQQRQQVAMALSQAEKELDRVREAHQRSQQRRSDVEQQMRALRGEAEELKAQLAQQDDLSTGLRDEMRNAGALWVDEILQVPEGLEAAVAAALHGQAADAYLPDGLDVAGIRELCVGAKEAPIAIFSSAEGVLDGGEGQNLAMAIAMDAEHPLYAMFTQVTLCDDVFSVVQPISGTVVSRDGWRLQMDGWLIPPTRSLTARRLVLQRQLRTCEQKLATIRRDVEEAALQLKQAEKLLTAQQQAWQQTYIKMTETENSVKAAEASHQRTQDALVAANSRLVHLQQEREAIAKDIIHWQEQQKNVGQLDKQQLDAACSKLANHTQQLEKSEQVLQHAHHRLATAEQALALHQQAIENLKREQQRCAQEQGNLRSKKAQNQRLLTEAQTEMARIKGDVTLDLQLAKAVEVVESAHKALNAIRQDGHQRQQKLHQYENEERKGRGNVQQAVDARQTAAIQQATEQARLQDMNEEIRQRLHCEVSELIEKLQEAGEVDHAEVTQRATQLEERLSRFGPVNLLAIEEFQQANEREGFLATQASDLETSLTTLTDTISRIDRTTRQRFKDVFEQTNAIFKQTFPRLFGGGRAELRLDSDDVLTAGVDVIAQPPGKKLQDITLLSGGEKALTAVALVFSIFRIKPAPFCILDEVDAPLDDANVGRFGEMIHELADQVQFLAISHNKITMQRADHLIGVSMPEPGVSKIVTVELN